MYYTRYTDATHFIEDTFIYLLKQEAQNNLLIANAIQIREVGVEGNIMATIKNDEGDILLSAIMTPPFNLVIYATDNQYTEEALTLLSRSLYESCEKLPGVIGEKALVADFTRLYCSLTHQTFKTKLGMNVYNLTKVEEVAKPSGKLRLATTKDLFYLPYWRTSFIYECGLRVSAFDEAVTRTTQNIESENIYIWEDGYPVSIAAKGRKLLNGVSIALVYTPPHFRGHKYASACVSTLSQKCLDEGYKFVCLFADTLNPISNQIYTNMGFQFICEYEDIQFI